MNSFTPDPLGQLTALPLQCIAKSHWFPAHNRWHPGGGQFWSRYAVTV